MAQSPFLVRLLVATNAHDVEHIVDCFTPEYVNETPCHPARGFRGKDQVRRNWTAILTAVPDLVASVVDEVTCGEQVWSEWELRGTRREGERHLMRGVMVFWVEGDRARSCRFYMEPVVTDATTADGFVASLAADGAS
jgi:hypothetical protein